MNCKACRAKYCPKALTACPDCKRPSPAGRARVTFLETPPDLQEAIRDSLNFEYHADSIDGYLDVTVKPGPEGLSLDAWVQAEPRFPFWRTRTDVRRRVGDYLTSVGFKVI